MTYAKDSTPSRVVWLTCEDLYHGNVKGCLPHSPDRLFGVDRALDCECDPNVRWDADSCADPYVHRIPGRREGQESRIGLRLCCRCHGAFDRALRISVGYGSDPSEFYRLPRAEREHWLRRFVARIVREARSERGYVSGWSPASSSRRNFWCAQIASERNRVAA